MIHWISSENKTDIITSATACFTWEGRIYSVTKFRTRGCHFPDTVKFPDFSRPRPSSTWVGDHLGGLGAWSPRKFLKLGSSTWLKMNFRQQNSLTFGILSQIPWLFQVFQVSRNPGTGNEIVRPDEHMSILCIATPTGCQLLWWSADLFTTVKTVCHYELPYIQSQQIYSPVIGCSLTVLLFILFPDDIT